MVFVIERLDEIVKVAEHEEQRQHHHEFLYGELHHALHVEEVKLEDAPHRVGEVEHIGCPPYRHQYREHADYRNHSHINHVVEPCHVDVLVVAHVDDAQQRATLGLGGFLF